MTHKNCNKSSQQLTDISEELSRSRCGEIQASAVQVCILFAEQVSIVDLEDLVQAELEETL